MVCSTASTRSGRRHADVSYQAGHHRHQRDQAVQHHRGPMGRRTRPVGAGPRAKARARTPPATIRKEIRRSVVLAGSTNESRLISPGGGQVQATP